MTSKTRMIAALAGKPTDHLPVAPLYLDLYLDREVRRRALAGYLEKMGDRLEVDMQTEWELQVQAKAVEETFTALQARPDWICWMTQLPPTAWLSDCALKRQNGKLWRIHRPSGEMEELSSVEPIFEEMSDLWNLPAPRDDQEINRRVPLLTHEEIVQSGALDLLARLLMDLGEEYFVCAGMSTAFTACYFLLGFQSLMTMPYEDENLFRYLLEFFFRWPAANDKQGKSQLVECLNGQVDTLIRYQSRDSDKIIVMTCGNLEPINIDRRINDLCLSIVAFFYPVGDIL